MNTNMLILIGIGILLMSVKEYWDRRKARELLRKTETIASDLQKIKNIDVLRSVTTLDNIEKEMKAIRGAIFNQEKGLGKLQMEIDERKEK